LVNGHFAGYLLAIVDWVNASKKFFSRETLFQQCLEAAQGALVNLTQRKVWLESRASRGLAENFLHGRQLVTIGRSRDEGGTQSGRVQHVEPLDRRLENIRYELGNAIVFGGSTGESDAFDLHAHPLRVEAHVEKLSFQ
jgi:hypothetical protein